MAELVLIHGTDPLRLLEHAAGGFLTPRHATDADPFPSPHYLLALRQGGIRDDLLRLATERGIPGWFDPPLCVFQELPARLGHTDREPCGDFEREVLLASVLRRAGQSLFATLKRPAEYVDAVSRHFGELIAEGVTAAQYAAALVPADVTEEFEQRRNADLAGAYALYCADLEREGCRDGRDNLADCAVAIAASPPLLGTKLGGRREVRLFGVSDLRGGMRLLLRALLDSPALDRVVLYTTEPLDLGPDLSASGSGEDAETLNGVCVARVGAGVPDRASCSTTVIDAPDTEREVEAVAHAVRALADQGTPLGRIAVVTRQARPYVDLLAQALERLGVPAAARRRVAYAEIPVVRAVLALLAAAGDGWSRHGLTELAEQPYFTSTLDARLLAFLGYEKRLLGLAAWEQAFEELVRRTDPSRPERDEAEGYRPRLPAHERALLAHDGFRSFSDRAAPLAQPRALAEWLDWLSQFLDEDPWEVRKRIYQLAPRAPTDFERIRVARLDLTGWKGIRAVTREWHAALTRWGGGEEPLTTRQFHARLSGMLTTDAVVWSETPAGVQVLEGLAAVYRSFDHLFVVGLTSDLFPRRAPLSSLFSEEERRRMAAAGLPLELREIWDTRERALFRDLVSAAADSLTISAPRLAEGGQETVPSVFLEELADAAAVRTIVIPTPQVLTPGTPLVLDAAAIAHAARVAQVERERQTGELGPYNGRIEDPSLRAWLTTERGDDYIWSPTQLEEYAKCPWAYFSGRLLRLTQHEDPDDDPAATLRGTILHDVLRRFYDRARERNGAPVFLRASDLAWAEPMLEVALHEALGEIAQTSHLGHPTLLAIREAEFSRQLLGYLTAETELHDEMFDTGKRSAPAMVRTAVSEHEVSFADVSLVRGGVTVRYRGRIDRIEVGADERVDARHLIAAVDYKSSKSSTPGKGGPKAWEEKVVLQVPLYIHALSLLRPGLTACRVEYRELKKGERVHSLQPWQVDRKAGKLKQEPKDLERLEGALAAVIEHVSAVRRGEFPAAPPPSCGCPPWCHGREICRVPGGPRETR